jgi:hypothetical protein
MLHLNQRNIVFLIGCSLLTGGCAMQQGDFPSLAKRPYESKDPIADPVGQPATYSTSLPDSLRNQLNSIAARHDAAEAAFRGALPVARQAAQSAAGSAMGSEGWVKAQMELSRLEKKRADSLAALAEIDRLVTSERDKGADVGLIGLMAPVQQRVQREADAQTAILEELTRLIG